MVFTKNIWVGFGWGTILGKGSLQEVKTGAVVPVERFHAEK